jgi:hypothetical protein
MVMTGCWMTVKALVLTVDPAEVVTVTGPEDAPAGTATAICELE